MPKRAFASDLVVIDGEGHVNASQECNRDGRMAEVEQARSPCPPVPRPSGASAGAADAKLIWLAQVLGLGIDCVGWALFRPRPPHPEHRPRNFGEQLASLD